LSVLYSFELFTVRLSFYFSLFFFQAEDGIRYRNVTGVQTCALPISFRIWDCRMERRCSICGSRSFWWDERKWTRPGRRYRRNRTVLGNEIFIDWELILINSLQYTDRSLINKNSMQWL